MALTGNTVQSTYLDLVQLEQSGAGLPSHAGKEAALYDGSGAQILGRSAVRHWLDPHPDAASFAETWEFSTTGDMTQGQLETAGWTFTNCTAEVAHGVLWVTASSAAIVKASIDVNFTGDFDFVITPMQPSGYGVVPVEANIHAWGGGGVGDTTNNVAHYLYGAAENGRPRIEHFYSGAYTTLGGTQQPWNIYGMPLFLRVWRVSAAVNCRGGIYGLSALQEDETAPQTHGWSFINGPATVSDSNAFDKLFLTATDVAAQSGSTFGIQSIMRFQ